MLNRDLWLFINSFADWLSAIGTIGAVVVALYLARRDSRITLKIAAGIRLIVQRGVKERPEYFSLEVTNVGRRSARITNLVLRDGIRIRLLRFQFGAEMIMLPPNNALSAGVPQTLNDGEEARYLVEWPEFEKTNGDMIREHFGGWLGPIRARLLRAGVLTSAGGITDVRIEKRLAARLEEVARQAP